MSIERVNLDVLGTPVGPYTHVVKHEQTLYTSGLTAFNTKAQTRGIAQQVTEIMRQLTLIAEHMQTSLQHLVKVTIFVPSFDEISSMRDTLFAAYGEHIPASSMVKVAGLFHDDLRVEIEAVLAVPSTTVIASR